MNSTREGFGIVEVIVSMVLLAVVLTTLAGLTYTTAQQAIVAGNSSTRQAASLGALNRLAALPFAQLGTAVGCDTTGTQNNLYERCVTVTSLAGTARQVDIVTTPLQRGVPASTVRLVRSAPTPPNPLCTGC